MKARHRISSDSSSPGASQSRTAGNRRYVGPPHGLQGADRPLIVQYWHDGAPPAYIEELLETFREHNPEMTQLVFDEASAEDLIGERLGEREVAAFRSCAVPSMQADYFRYCAALVLGGLYSDADLRCISSFQPDMPAPGEGWLILRPSRPVVNGLFAFGSPGHPLLKLTVELATTNIEHRRWSVYMATGPGLWTTLYWVHRVGSFNIFAENAPTRGSWAKYARWCEEMIGGHERLRRAFQGVRIRKESELESVVQECGMDIPYKKTDVHWINFKGSVYR
jgi:hypothetical protein